VQVNDGMPEDEQFRVTRSHSNLVNRMSMLMLDRPESGDAKQGSIARRKLSSPGHLLPFVHYKARAGESSEDDDSDKEEHIVRIDSPSALFHASRPDQT